MKQYLDMLSHILEYGEQRDDRTGVGTIGVFGYQFRHNLSAGFPLLTTKKIHFKSVIYELLWFLRGDSNIKYLKDNGINIWDEWADKNGGLGPIYGVQWRQWNNQANKIDQISDVIQSIKTNPHSRRHLVSAWNVGDITQMKLPPCHYAFQFYVSVNKKLSCCLNMRSCDSFLGGGFNIASYALLTHMIAQICNLQVGELIISFGDLHIYLNHLNQVKEQLSRQPYGLPKLILNSEIKNIDDFKYEDVKIENYIFHPAIKAPIAI